MNGLNRRGVAELFAQLGYVLIQSTRIAVVFNAPDVVQQGVPGKHFALMMAEIYEQSHLPVAQRIFFFAAYEAVSLRIHFAFAKLERLSSMRAIPRGNTRITAA